ncbi:putative two-component response regulator protein [Mesorhizobium metallidurans STM 2683]|uniref:Putative two-component response regulator protein n=1 Tax=Mesorhizobium metallidurans STM 2683 TaxID=1297569 RepID=M5EMW1_9HYPH|nr:response regulator [Mesorhizobium metallidurans]CCV05677.1 putative two-component response regulator protein [Mesorhizobium metallidurans STM 2683]
MRKPLALIVEDEAMIVIDLEASLKRAGFTVVAAPTCIRTQQILALVDPDIAILDVLLHDCETGEVAEEFVARQIPFLIYSGTDLEGRSDAFKCGTFVAKPTDASELVKLMLSMARPSGLR